MDQPGPDDPYLGWVLRPNEGRVAVSGGQRCHVVGSHYQAPMFAGKIELHHIHTRASLVPWAALAPARSGLY